MIALKIDNADVILNDLGDGNGKIIISDSDWGYDFSYYWGAMGSRSLSDFLISMGTDYFVNKLGPHDNGEINSKGTIKKLRESIKDYFSSDFPWYTVMEFQKDLRSRLNKLQRDGFCSPEHFFDELNEFRENLDYYSIDSKYDRESIQAIFKSICDEPWYYLAYDEHREKVYLAEFHKKLIEALKKSESNLETVNQI